MPLGPGLVVRRLSLSAGDVVWLRGILVGYEGLASAHGDDGGIVALVAPEDRAVELDDWIDEVAREIPLRRL